MNRRGFLGSILAIGAAPAIVKASSLMRVIAPSRAIAMPTFAEIVQTTLRTRSGELADIVSSNNALMDLMEARMRASMRQIVVRIDADLYRMAA